MSGAAFPIIPCNNIVYTVDLHASDMQMLSFKIFLTLNRILSQYIVTNWNKSVWNSIYKNWFN